MQSIDVPLRLSGVIRESIVDGPGIRMVVFSQGCAHNCAGCHNPATHDMNGGYMSSVNNIIEVAKNNPLLKGLTFSGGEPFLQAEAFEKLARQAHLHGLDVITYSGFTYEELLAGSDAVLELLGETDVLVDGKYVESQKDFMLRFRGSKNQRVIDVKASHKSNAIIELDW